MTINNIYRAYITVRRSEPLKLELAWAVCANVVIMVINIIVGLILARSLDYGDYGRLSYFINTFGALRLLASLGMTSQITYELSCARGHTKSIEDRFYPLLIIRLGSLLGLNIIVIGLAYLRCDQTFIIAAIASALALMHDF